MAKLDEAVTFEGGVLGDLLASSRGVLFDLVVIGLPSSLVSTFSAWPSPA
jgi:hypothetical protein